MEKSVQSFEAMAARMRRDMIQAAERCGGDVHWGGALSCTDILAVLYGGILDGGSRKETYADRDKFLLSKGQSAIALYAALVESGREEPSRLQEFQQNGSLWAELAILDEAHGVECSGGSLGLGLSMGAGMALAAKRKKMSYHTYVLTGDGEMNEGAVWEAVMLAGQLGLDNLTLIVDRNQYQSDGANEEIISMRALEEQLKAFRWEATTVDGHNYEMLWNAFSKKSGTCPRAIIADTVKGKGISFMEGDNEWHHKILNKTLLESAKQEVGGIV
ncbi:transketolase [Hominifimenecus sp. rT4P-3]|uniref:transketolase n=1 Tax=Hominifimenecus sp. rT4P-3 TaxID=3242979 RepID=UPI003DA2EC3C